MANPFQRLCEKCGRDLNKVEHFETVSILHPSKILNICGDCVADMLYQHPYDLHFADKLCQWADIPFDVDEWAKIYEISKERTFSSYFMMYSADERQDVNWTAYNKKWIKADQAGNLVKQVEIFNSEQLRLLRQKWGPQYDDDEITYLEQLLAGMLQTQNINGKLQMDQAVKLCKISLIIDQKIRAEENFKDELANYDKLVKIADFTPKNVKNGNDFDSAGEIFAYLEKTGWQNKYYEGAIKDIVDKSMANIQAWLQHLYVNETNISEDIEHKIEGLKMARQLEEQTDNALEEEISDVEEYEFEDADFEVDI